MSDDKLTVGRCVLPSNERPVAMHQPTPKPQLPAPILLAQRLHADAKLPMRSSAGAIGYDLHAYLPAPLDIAPGERASIPTGIVVGISPGHYLRIAPRSGLAVRSGLDVLAGVVDPDFRGQLMVVLLNTDRHTTVRIEPGERIAQAILEQASTAEVMEVNISDLTQRASGAFGSTGRF